MNTQTLSPVQMFLLDVELTAYDCGDRWNGFIVPLFTAQQILLNEGLFVDCDVQYNKTSYVSENGEKLYQINSGFVFSFE